MSKPISPRSPAMLGCILLVCAALLSPLPAQSRKHHHKRAARGAVAARSSSAVGTGSVASANSAAGGSSAAGAGSVAGASSVANSSSAAGSSSAASSQSGAPIDPALAERGKQLFKSKTCASCHAFGSRLTCPDLKPVPGQQSASWILSQIQHPDRMTATDPVAQKLKMEYQIQMPNLGITEPEARALLEYIRSMSK